eukprot:350573-Amphidinium_carterae.1
MVKAFRLPLSNGTFLGAAFEDVEEQKTSTSQHSKAASSLSPTHVTALLRKCCTPGASWRDERSSMSISGAWLHKASCLAVKRHVYGYGVYYLLN